MTKKNISFTPDVHQKLEELKNKHNFKTYNDFIRSVCVFLELNNYNPSYPTGLDSNIRLKNEIKYQMEITSREMKNSAKDLEEFMSENYDKNMKILRAMERDYFKPILAYQKACMEEIRKIKKYILDKADKKMTMTGKEVVHIDLSEKEFEDLKRSVS
jgi:hypothetical protein